MNDTFAETHIYTRDLRRILNSGGTNHCNGPIPANSASFLQANCPLPKKRSKRPSVGIVVRLGHHLARISVSFRRQLNKGTRNTQMFFSGVFFFHPLFAGFGDSEMRLSVVSSSSDKRKWGQPNSARNGLRREAKNPNRWANSCSGSGEAAA